MSIRKRWLLAISALFTVEAVALDRVSVGLAIPPSVHDAAPYAAAEELGLFAEHDLEVELLVFQGAGALLPQVANKRLTFGYPTSEPVIASHLNASDPLPLRYFYNGVPRNTMEFAVLASSSIDSLEELEDARVGVGALTWGTIPGARAALRSVGLEPGENVEFVAVGALGAGFQALRSGQVEALNFNSSWHDMLEQSGVEIRRIGYPEVFEETAGNGFIAHVDTFDENPELIERFGRVYAQAQYVCEVNPRFCVEAFWRAYPESRPGGDEETALAEAQELLERRLQRVLYHPDGSRRLAGEYDLDAIRQVIQAMADAGEYSSADVPVDEIFSNRFVESFDDFDRDELRARAEAAR